MSDLEEKDIMNGILEMLTESWRLYHYTDDLVQRLVDVRMKKRGQNQIARFEKRMNAAMDKFQLELVDFAGQDYVTELPVRPINLDDFSGEDHLFIEVTLEPTIKKKKSAEIIHTGVVVVGRREE